MRMQVKLLIPAVFLGLLSLTHTSPLPSAPLGGVSGEWRPVYQLSQEWNHWKTDHERRYVSDNEELERHLIWLSNMKYIEGHNANEHMFGYRLSMNQYGDLVGTERERMNRAFYSNCL